MPHLKKVSVVSVESIKIRNLKLQKHWDSVDLKDNFYYVHILFLLMGLMHFLPYTFFVTANAFWMQKFRNVSADDLSDASKRTYLQSHFASTISITTTVSNSTFVVLSALFGYKFKARSRILGALAIITICFTISTLFVEINTDSWQTLFFVVTMVILTAINGANATLQIAVLAVLAKFPPRYMKFYLFGEGCAAVFNSILQIVTLAVGTSVITSALIYFVLGSSIIGLTFILFFFTNSNKFYKYFVEHSAEDEMTRDMLSFSEFKDVLGVIWISILMYMSYDLVKIPQSAVTTLVVSENYGNGNEWNDVYFVPVITFFLADVCTLLGRLCSSALKALSPSLSLISSFVRIIIYLPLIFLSNAQPRKHLPVLLNHDWEYIIIQGTLSFSNGYLFNMIFLSINKLMEPGRIEDGYLVLMTGICTIGAVLSPLANLSVDVL